MKIARFVETGEILMADRQCVMQSAVELIRRSGTKGKVIFSKSDSVIAEILSSKSVSDCLSGV